MTVNFGLKINFLQRGGTKSECREHNSKNKASFKQNNCFLFFLLKLLDFEMYCGVERMSKKNIYLQTIQLR